MLCREVMLVGSLGEETSEEGTHFCYFDDVVRGGGCDVREWGMVRFNRLL